MEARLSIAVLLTSTYQLLFGLRGHRLGNWIHGSGRKRGIGLQGQRTMYYIGGTSKSVYSL